MNKWFIPLISLIVIGLFGATCPATQLDIGNSNAGDIAWMLTASALVLLMTPGLSFFYGGMVNKKNVISTMLQSMIALGVISILWVLVGFSLAFGDSIHGFIGNPFTYAMFKNVGCFADPRLCPTIPLLLFALFQLKFAIITPALITGSFAERVRFPAYLLFISLFSIFIYAPLAHWTWHPDGIFHKLGILDQAGGLPVHTSAGLAALIAAIFVGRRNSRNHEPANIPFVILGTGMLWFGWFGFNAGSACAASGLAVLSFATTNMASASGMLTWTLVDCIRGKKPSAIGACVGAVVGLVSITPACAFVNIATSIFIGAISAVICNFVTEYIKESAADDALDVFACHGVGGIVGMILTGVFATNSGLINGGWRLFLSHIIAVVSVIAYVLPVTYLLVVITNKFTLFRADEMEEAIGLDLSQHNESI